MKTRIVGLLGGVLVCGATALHAEPITPVTITFENPPCAFDPAGGAFSDCYLNRGVFLTSFIPNPAGPTIFTEFSIHSAADAVSPPNVAADILRFDPGNPGGLRGDFFIAPNQPTGWTNMVSFNVTGSQPASAPWTVQFLGSDDTLLGSFSGTSNERVSFSQPVPNIHTFMVFSGSSTQAIDNLTFNPVTTPEPASLVLLGSGLAGIVLGRSRRKRPLR